MIHVVTLVYGHLGVAGALLVIDGKGYTILVMMSICSAPGSNTSMAHTITDNFDHDSGAISHKLGA